MLLLTEEPAGIIPTQTAGAAEFAATLTWRSLEETPSEPLLPTLPGSETRTVKCSITEDEAPESCTRLISVLIQALDEVDLTVALDFALRSVNEAATLTQALLEARSVRLSSPRSFPISVRRILARDLKDSGFEVRFAPVWTSLSETGPETPRSFDVALGTRGAEPKVRAFIEGHPSWKMAVRPDESLWSS